MMAKHKYIETPEELQQMWEDYKAQVGFDNLPVLNIKTGDVALMPNQKPWTRWGFEAYVFKNYGYGVKQYLDNQDKAYNAYLGVVTYIRNEWTDDHVSGTMTGKYKAASLTARVTGVSDNVDITTNGKDINEIKVNIIKADDK
jgi:hypothetical protein